MMQKLSAWKANSPSLAGRLTLCFSVLSTMPTYLMQTTLLPSSVCSIIDFTYRKFLWGAVEKCKIHLCSWNQICKPKCGGRLGLRHASFSNLAFMSKFGWGLICSEDLWAWVLHSQYRCRADLIPSVRAQAGCSNLWRGICRAWPMVEKDIIWCIGDGASIKLW